VTAVMRAADRPPEGGVRFSPLERQHAALEPELSAVLARLLRTSGFILGEEVERFEEEFAQFCQVGHCVGVSSGTAALALTLRASGIGPGDEVIVPAHTYVASALAVAHAGAVPVLCDVDEGSGLIDPEAARALVGPRTAAIIGVHLYGQAFDIAAIESFARPAGLMVLEDAAQAHGAGYRGRRVGSLGAAAAFSFYPSKNLGALGDGGAVCTTDPSLAERLRRLRNLGQRTKGEHVELGYNARLDGLQAAVLRVKLSHLDAWNAARRAHAVRYRALLSDTVRMLEERRDSPCVYHVFPVRLAGRDALASALRRRGIETGIHYAAVVHAHRLWADNEIRHGSVPRAEAWAAEEISLPMHPDLKAAEIDHVAEAIHQELALARPAARPHPVGAHAPPAPAGAMADNCGSEYEAERICDEGDRQDAGAGEVTRSDQLVGADGQ
jgi:dTDP-3-amino-3,4,6-trideoxy-alpha-D-glucose transaminase